MRTLADHYLCACASSLPRSLVAALRSLAAEAPHAQSSAAVRMPLRLMSLVQCNWTLKRDFQRDSTDRTGLLTDSLNGTDLCRMLAIFSSQTLQVVCIGNGVRSLALLRSPFNGYTLSVNVKRFTLLQQAATKCTRSLRFNESLAVCLLMSV